MNTMKQDEQQLSTLLQQVVQHSMHFFDTLQTRPVTVEQTIPEQVLLNDGVGAEAALAYFTTYFAEKLSASAGSRYLGFVTGGATPASIIGDWLVTVYDQNVSNTQGSVAAAIERETIDLLKQLFHISDDFTGAFTSGATMSNFVGLAQARQWVALQQGINVTVEGLYNVRPFPIFSAAPHSSVFKSLSMLGIGKQSVQLVPCLPNREAIDIDALTQRLEAQQGEPCVVVASAGTVNTVDFDDLRALAQLKEHYNFWLHVDAAFGGFASCSDQYRTLTAGMNAADSITIDAHKWLNVPYDAAMQFTRHEPLQIDVFQNNAAYLGTNITQPDFFDLTPENSRRFRALPAWFTLKAYGRSGYAELVEQNVAVAQQLGQLLHESTTFKLLAPVRLNVVCFTLNDDTVDATTIAHFLQTLHEGGHVFMTPTNYSGTPGIRAAFSNWRSTSEDVSIIVEALHEAARILHL